MAFGIKALADDGGSKMNAGYLRVAGALWIVALVAGGYAESYPNRPAAENMSEYVTNGIVCGNAVRERELAVNRSQNFLPYCGTWQPYIASLQQELETLAPIYIDHENGPLTDAGDAFLYFTLDNWRAAAGLNANGFRRSTDGISFSYGRMQSGDIIGPWIFEDLQTGFGTLRWTMRLSSENKAQQKSAYGYGTGTCAGDYAMHNAEWSTAIWNTEIETAYVYYADAAEGSDAGGGFTTNRQRGKAAINNVPTTNPCIADIYLVPSGHPQIPGTFHDIDGMGHAEGVYFLSETLAQSSSATRESSSTIGNISASTVSIMGYSCPIEYHHAFYGYGNSYWLLKWNFTNQNP